MSVSFLAVGAGDATSSDAILWTRAQDSANTQGVGLMAQVSTDPTFASGLATFAGATDPAHDYTIHVDATGLQPDTQYSYRFVATDNTVSQVGTFHTAPLPTADAPVHFGFSGDADGLMRPYSSTGDATAAGVPSFSQQKFNYFVWLGDTIYETASGQGTPNSSPAVNSTPNVADYWKKYREQFLPVSTGAFPGLSNFFNATGHYTLLDNHELGNKQYINGGAAPGTPAGAGVDATNPANDVNTTGTFMNQTPGFKTLQQAYSDYQPIRAQTVNAPSDPRSNGTQKLYFAQQWGKNSTFFNLDDRSYRDIRLKTAGGADDNGPRADNPGRTMLGTTQLQWFEQSLLDAQAQHTTWKIVAVSSPIDQIANVGGSFTVTNAAGNYSTTESDGGKSWMGGYRAERNQLLKFIADHHIDHVVFLTTDDHQVRVNELGYFTDTTDPTTSAAYQASYTRVPGCFQIVCGPIGATGPDGVTDHSIPNLQSLAQSFSSQQAAAGVDPLGLDPNFPGLQNVSREGDPNANTNRSPFDFYSPDTFNYAVLDLDATGQHFTVTVDGINSYPVNTFPQPSASNPVRQIFQFTIAAQPGATGASASYVTTDTATQGNWKGKYGGQGFAIAGDASSLPPSVLSTDASGPYVYSASTSDPRALQKSATGATSRVEAAWFDVNSFRANLNLADGKTHQVTLYVAEYDSQNRHETIDVLDSTSGQVLASQPVSNFGNGADVVFNVSGKVSFRLTRTSGGSATLSGLFLDAGTASPSPSPTPAPTPTPAPAPPSASFVTTDSTSQGNWKGKYGSQGFAVAGDATSLTPSQFSVAAYGPYVYSSSTGDPRALQKSSPTSADRVEAAWYDPGALDVNLNLTDGKKHRVALHVADYDNQNRSERVDVLDPSTGKVLATQTISSFGSGKYLLFDVMGAVTFHVTRLSGGSATLEGLFVDPVS